MESSLNGLLTKDSEYIDKCEEYMSYIRNHKDNVKEAFFKYFRDKIHLILGKINGEYIECDDERVEKFTEYLETQIDKHDDSKYSDEEFEPYRLHFYPTTEENQRLAEDEEFSKLADELYEDAWHHHYTHNPHHPEYFIWVLPDGTILDKVKTEPDTDMDLCCIIEMLCDWAAMSKFFNQGDYLTWYLSNKSSDERNAMSPHTKELVRTITEIILPDRYEETKESEYWI